MTFFAKRSRLICLALLLALVIVGYVIVSAMPADMLYTENNVMLKNGELPDIIAHRGGADEFPENTLEAFYNAYSIDENVIMETDVNITKDGVLILLHNEMLDSTTNVTGLASDWNYSDLIAERVDFGYDNPTEDTVLAGEREYFTVNGERRYPTDVTYPDGVMPRDNEIYLATTFEELLVAFPKSRISVEIKQKGDLGLEALEELIRLLEKYDAFGRVLVATFHSNVSREIKRLIREDLVPDEFMYSPDIIGVAKYYAFMTLGAEALFGERIAALQISTGELGFDFATKRMVDSAHARGVAVQYWTIDDEDEMRMLIALGTDGIMTDNPSVLKKVLDEYKNK